MHLENKFEKNENLKKIHLCCKWVETKTNKQTKQACSYKIGLSCTKNLVFVYLFAFNEGMMLKLSNALFIIKAADMLINIHV